LIGFLSSGVSSDLKESDRSASVDALREPSSLGGDRMKVFLIASLLLFPGVAALAYEQPHYEVVQEADDYEVRRYEAYLVAETEVSGSFEDVGNEAFRRLAGFLFGANRTREKMAMTAPVTQQPLRPAKLEKTAPVTQTARPGAAAYTFAFMMPARFTRETLPEPTDPRVVIREVPSRLLVARRFSGTWSADHFASNEATLRDAAQRAGFAFVGEPIYARYNAPFVPWFLRRNEVLLEVRE